MAENKIPVIIDSDPGIDDCMAITVAYSLPQLDIKALCTVAGNVGIEKVTRNARAILSTLRVKSKIYKGAAGPLMGGEKVEAPEAHGISGLGSYTVADDKLHPLEEMSALEAQRKILMESSGSITLIALGPLTNIALLIRSYPQVKSKIKQISLMGGGLYSGNHTPAAEFNILADPEAAAIVFESGIPIIMAGLDVTHKARIYGSQADEIKAINTPAADMIATVLEFYFKKYTQEERGGQYCCMHDSVAVLSLVYPDMFEGRNLHVAIETEGKYCRGYTVADLRRGTDAQPNCYVLLEVDLPRFYGEVVRAVKSYS